MIIPTQKDMIKEIIKMRKLLSWSQTKLANSAGVSQSLITKMEKGKINPSYESVEKIYNVLQNEMRKEHNMRTVRDISTSNLISVQKDDPLWYAFKLMKEYDVSQLPVFDGDVLVGSINESTILDNISSENNIENLKNVKVEKIMGEPFPQIDENTPVNAITPLLRHVDAILVTEKGKIKGIVTKANFLKMLDYPVISDYII